MKFTAKQLQDFAVKAGVPTVEIVADEKDADYNEDLALKAVHDSVTPLIKPGIESELTTALETKLKGKHSGEMYSLLAGESGLTRAELERMPVKDAAKFAFTHIASKLGKDAEQWKKELDDLVNTHNTNITKLTSDKDGEIAAAKQRYTDRDINSFLAESIVGKAPLLKAADKGYYAEQLRNHLQSKYHLSYDEATKAVKLFKKDNPQIPALNEAGTAAISMLDEFKGIATKAGVWQTDTRNERPDSNKGDAYKNPNQPATPRQRGSKRVSTDDMTAHLKQME